MDDQSAPHSPSTSDEANQHYQQGLDLKAKGQTDAALTAFRRAAIADPKAFAIQMEIGYLCREKAKRDPTFHRYVFEAFRQAARSNLEHEEAHNQYIMAGQKMGLLDALLMEYSDWRKTFPENKLFERCHKNILALSMALMPQQVSVGGGSHGSIRKIILVTAIVAGIMGLACFVAAPMLLKAGKIQKEQVGGIVRIGLLLEAATVGGFVLRSRIN